MESRAESSRRRAGVGRAASGHAELESPVQRRAWMATPLATESSAPTETGTS